jgi:YgiT-type zinc finger domain-containing protein
MTDESLIDQTEYIMTCPECQTGIMRLRYITYFTWLNQELITVPNFPAWICDLCGRRDYDSQAVIWLNAMLNPETGRRQGRRKKQLPPQMDHPSAPSEPA